MLFRAIIPAMSLTAMTATAVAQEMAVLEEIVVTARKRVELIQDVPISISTMSADEISLLTANGADLRFLNGRVPSLRVESSYGRVFPRFYIRGLGNSDFDLNASQPVSLVYDEVVLENPMLKGKPVFDLDQIMVARGPQGTHFGRNTPAGVVKLVSKRPTEELDGYAEVSYGTYDTTEINAAIGGPMSSILNGRISGQYINRNDWIDNEAPGFEAKDQLGGYTQWAARGQLLFDTGDDFFSALVSAHAWEIDDGTARIFHANAIPKGTNDLRPGFDPEKVYLDSGTRNNQNVQAWGTSLILEFDFGGVELISITGYEHMEMFSVGDVDGGIDVSWPVPASPGTNDFNSETGDGIPDLDQVTQELRLSSNGEGAFNWLVGLYYFNEDVHVESLSFQTLPPFGPPPPAIGDLNGFADQEQETDAWAVFGSVDWEVSDRWTLSAGLRYSDDEKDLVARRAISPLGFLGVVPTAVPVVEKTSDDFVSWDLSANFAINEDVNLYGRVATSNRAPSIQGRNLFAFDLTGFGVPDDGVSVADTEDIISGEIGVKSELFDNRLRLNAGVYVYQMSDQQISAVGGAGNTATLLNVDTTNGYGVEVDLNWVPIENLNINAGFSYNDTEWDDPNLQAATCRAAFLPEPICTVTDPIVNGFAQLDGNSLAQAPEIVFTGAIRYAIPFSNNNELYGTLDWAYQDESRFFLYESVEFEDDFLELGFFSNIVGMVADPATYGMLFNVKIGQ
jgi:iron complex outermembrane receptor protein